MSSYNDHLRKTGSLLDPSGNDIWVRGYWDAREGRPNARLTILDLWGPSAELPYSRGYASGERENGVQNQRSRKLDALTMTFETPRDEDRAES